MRPITVGILAIYYVLMFGASLFVSTFWDSHVAMGVLFSLSDGIGVVTGFLSGVIGITLNLQNIVCLYVKLEQSAGDPLCIGRAEECAASGKPFFEKQQRKGVFAFLLVILLEVFYVYSVISNGTQIFRDLYAGTLVTAHRGGAKTARKIRWHRWRLPSIIYPIMRRSMCRRRRTGSWCCSMTTI